MLVGGGGNPDEQQRQISHGYGNRAVEEEFDHKVFN